MTYLMLQNNEMYEVAMDKDTILGLTEKEQLEINNPACHIFGMIKPRHGRFVLVSNKAVEVNGHNTKFKILRHLDQIRVGSTELRFLTEKATHAALPTLRKSHAAGAKRSRSVIYANLESTG